MASGWIIVCLGSLFIGTVLAIQCWECKSYDDPKCADPYDNTTGRLVDCDTKTRPHILYKATKCRKIRQKVNGEWRYIRGCAFYGEPGLDGDERYCLLRSGTWDIHVEYCTCNSRMGCNDAKTVRTSKGLMFLLVMLGFVLKYCLQAVK